MRGRRRTRPPCRGTRRRGRWDDRRGRAARDVVVAANQSPSSRPGRPRVAKHRKKLECSSCDGSGKIKIPIDGKQEEKPCQICKGTGWL
jgi:hypothetical protein